MREPETLQELLEEIVRQVRLDNDEGVTITLTHGDGLHELIEDIKNAIKRKETIKGIDRVNAGYSQEIADKDKIIDFHRGQAIGQAETIIALEQAVKDRDERIASLLESDAGHPTRDINGTIEAQQSLIRKLKRDVMTLQAKVQEQDERLQDWSIACM